MGGSDRNGKVVPDPCEGTSGTYPTVGAGGCREFSSGQGSGHHADSADVKADDGPCHGHGNGLRGWCRKRDRRTGGPVDEHVCAFDEDVGGGVVHAAHQVVRPGSVTATDDGHGLGCAVNLVTGDSGALGSAVKEDNTFGGAAGFGLVADDSNSAQYDAPDLPCVGGA